MASWQQLLTKLVEHGPVEPMFEARKPSGKAWPKGLPSVPALVEFYALCDGGQLSALEVFPLQKVKTRRASLLSAIGVAEKVDRDKVIIFGENSFNFLHFVDTATDRVYACNPGAGADEWEQFGTTDEFLQALFTPKSKYRDEASDMWDEALEQLEQM